MSKIGAIRIAALAAIGCVLIFLAGAYALMAAYVYLQPSLPSVTSLRSGNFGAPLRVYTGSGQLIAQIGAKRQLPVAYRDIPPLVRDAFVSAEDAHFFQNNGFEYRDILRAMFVDLITGNYTQGASTITMQAARNMFLNFNKTIRRKLQEVFLTYRMDHEFSKQQILDTYLNVIFLGQRSYGVAAAAYTYFGKPLDQLTVAQTALLAGIPQAPSLYNPIFHPRAATARRRYVLGQMLRLGYIDRAAYRQADQEPIRVRDHGGYSEIEAPYVAAMAREALISRFGPGAVNAGYKVYTTIDGRLQTAADRAVRLGLIEYSRRYGYRGPVARLRLGSNDTPAQLDAALAGRRTIGDLHPAVVLSVQARSAHIYIRYRGFAQIPWLGLSWARPRLPGRTLGPAPASARDVVHRGDVVYVVSNDAGVADLAQVPRAEAALVALDPRDGAVAALVGGFDYYRSRFNRATQALRQAGSGFKPFLYSAALENGFTPSTIVMDAPITFGSNTQEKTWRPQNDGDGFDGPMRLREGLVFSRNLMTIRIVNQMGIDTALSYAARFGFNPEQLPHNLTLALGTAQVSPLQMATAYSVFANGGFRVDSFLIDRIENTAGQVVWQAQPKVACAACESPAASASPAADRSSSAGPATLTPPLAATPAAPAAGATAAPASVSGAAVNASAGVAQPGGLTATAFDAAASGAAGVSPGGLPPIVGPVDPNRIPPNPLPPLLPAALQAPRVITADNAWLMDSMMHSVITRGTGVMAGRELNRSDIAGKTGTTNQARDAWFNGFSRQIVASVWVGFDDGRPLGPNEQGGVTAIPIWIDFMREALRGIPDRPRAMPPGLVTVRIDKSSGLMVGPDDSDAMYETFMANHLPARATAGSAGAGSAEASGQPLF